MIYRIRRANITEANKVASVFRRSRGAFLSFVPRLYTAGEEKTYFHDVVLQECEVWSAEDEGEAMGICAFRRGWVDHLYLLPGYTGRGIGEKLLSKAKAQYSVLQLWVFQQNTDAIRFYEKQGFHRVMETDGSGNEEKLPDMLMKWQLKSQ